VIRVRAGKAEWIDVRSGINIKDKVEIFGDLQEGDQLSPKRMMKLRLDKKWCRGNSVIPIGPISIIP